MEEKKLGLSLKYKLLIMLTAIPVVSLATYFFLATAEFKEDKIAYVHDSSAAVARSTATQVRAEVAAFFDKAKVLADSFDPFQNQFREAGVRVFENTERLDTLVILSRVGPNQFKQVGQLQKDTGFLEEFQKEIAAPEFRQLLEKGDELFLSAPKNLTKHLIIGFVTGRSNSADQKAIVGLYRAADLRDNFVNSKLYKLYLISKNGKVQLGPDTDESIDEVFSRIYKSGLPEGSLEVVAGEEKLVGYANTKFDDLMVASIVSKRSALRAVDKLIIKSITFFVALISATVLIGLIASVKLTSALSDLFEATKKIAKGQFDIRVQRRTNDEVGGLTDGFNFMAEEVSRLMEETKEKARMEGELETVKLVQETLFPKPVYSVGPFKVMGHFEPASECGGDWWNYSIVGDRLYLWIGDATGHGAPAAMVTSAAKAAATIIETLPGCSPSKALEVMNKAIHETTKGRILMTFFVASLDLKTGEVLYSNASHDPPYIVRNTGGKITKKNLEPLIDANGPRLGDKKDSTYTEANVSLNSGDTILFYTDGIIDLENEKGESWGERGFIRSVVQSAGAGADVNDRMIHLKSTISGYRGKGILVDDITLFMCQYDGEGKAAA